jgi:hypothetical protein
MIKIKCCLKNLSLVVCIVFCTFIDGNCQSSVTLNKRIAHIIQVDAEQINREFSFGLFPIDSMTSEPVYIIDTIRLEIAALEDLSCTLIKATVKFGTPFNNLFDKPLVYYVIADGKNNLYPFDGFAESYAVAKLSNEKVNINNIKTMLLNTGFLRNNYVNNLMLLLNDKLPKETMKREVLTSNIKLVANKGKKINSLSKLSQIIPYTNKM